MEETGGLMTASDYRGRTTACGLRCSGYRHRSSTGGLSQDNWYVPHTDPMLTLQKIAN